MGVLKRELLGRSLLLGIAAGMRSSLGLTGPGLFRPERTASDSGRAIRVLAIGAELVIDKLPQTPSRLEPPGLAVRFASGAGGALTLAHREGVATDALLLPTLAGAAGVACGAYGGAAWRRWNGARRPDWHGAAIEDVVGLALAYQACRRR
jgi:uncharacterized membrane protein